MLGVLDATAQKAYRIGIDTTTGSLTPGLSAAQAAFLVSVDVGAQDQR